MPFWKILFKIDDSVSRSGRHLVLHLKQIPASVMRQIVRKWTVPGAMVVDACMGTSTMSIACLYKLKCWRAFGCDNPSDFLRRIQPSQFSIFSFCVFRKLFLVLKTWKWLENMLECVWRKRKIENFSNHRCTKIAESSTGSPDLLGSLSSSCMSIPCWSGVTRKCTLYFFSIVIRPIEPPLPLHEWK